LAIVNRAARNMGVQVCVFNADLYAFGYTLRAGGGVFNKRPYTKMWEEYQRTTRNSAILHS
jgi:hypothetical protein